MVSADLVCEALKPQQVYGGHLDLKRSTLIFQAMNQNLNVRLESALPKLANRLLNGSITTSL